MLVRDLTFPAIGANTPVFAAGGLGRIFDRRGVRPPTDRQDPSSRGSPGGAEPLCDTRGRVPNGRHPDYRSLVIGGVKQEGCGRLVADMGQARELGELFPRAGRLQALDEAAIGRTPVGPALGYLEPGIDQDGKSGRLLTRSIGSAAMGLPAVASTAVVAARWPPAGKPIMPNRLGSMRKSAACARTKRMARAPPGAITTAAPLGRAMNGR